MPDDNGVIPIREHYDAVLAEQRRALEIAEREREKAASALRVELERAISEGDKALRDHIAAQVQQIKAALESAERLEVQRFDSLKREMTLITEAAQTAIDKLAEAYEKRFEQQNEWRAQSADRERSQQEEMTKLSGQFMLREVADSKIEDVRREIAALSDKVNKLV